MIGKNKKAKLHCLDVSTDRRTPLVLLRILSETRQETRPESMMTSGFCCLDSEREIRHWMESKIELKMRPETLRLEIGEAFLSHWQSRLESRTSFFSVHSSYHGFLGEKGLGSVEKAARKLVNIREGNLQVDGNHAPVPLSPWWRGSDERNWIRLHSRTAA